MVTLEDSSQHVAFIALPAGFDKKEWKARLQKRTDAVMCLSFALNNEHSNAALLCRSSVAEFQALVAEIGVATNRTIHANAQFAALWDADQCECTQFADILTAWDAPSAKAFEITLLCNATEHVRITCLHGYSDKHSNHSLIRKNLASWDFRVPYIFGGCFGIEAGPIWHHTETEVQTRKLKGTPRLLMNASTRGPDPALLMHCSDAFDAEPIRDGTPHCTCIALTASAKTSQPHDPCGSTEDDAAIADAASPPASEDASDATEQTLLEREKQHHLDDVVDLLSVLLTWGHLADLNVPPRFLSLQARGAVEAQAWSNGVLRQLSNIANLFFWDKEGKNKDTQKIVDEMAAANVCRQQIIARHMEATGGSTFEESPESYTMELSCAQVIECYKEWVINFWETSLSSQQRNNAMYRLKFDADNAMHLSTRQRSFINNMLRKRFASKHVAYTIWQIGLPSLLAHPPAALEDPYSHKPLLQSAAEELVVWLGRLGAGLHQRSETEDYQEQKRRSGSSYRSSDRTEEYYERKRKREDRSRTSQVSLKTQKMQGRSPFRV